MSWVSPPPGPVPRAERPATPKPGGAL